MNQTLGLTSSTGGTARFGKTGSADATRGIGTATAASKTKSARRHSDDRGIEAAI